MKTIHFTARSINNDGEEVYQLTINGKAWTYNRDTDFLENVKTGYLIERSELSANTLKAFHKAWNPDLYAKVCEDIPVNEYGIPMANEDPNSPFYDPVRPEGYPEELRETCEKQDRQQDMAALAVLALAAGGKVPDDAQARDICQAINSIGEDAK